MNMLERVARALCNRADDEFEANRDFWLPYAVAAIEAMRDPPENYISQSPPFAVTDGGDWYPPNDVRAGIWRDMITACLTPKEG